jgi:carboxypeptidase C (cathepsin A)
MSRGLLLAMLVVLAAASSGLREKEELQDTDGPWDYLGLTGYAGYITMNPLTGSSLFYWLFESIGGNITADSRPLIIWVEGGPGCSGSITMLWEGISPLTVNSNPIPARTNPAYTWGTSYHIISIDFPYGAGYSFANSEGDNKNSTQAATYYLWRCLYKLNAKYPTWFSNNRPVFIFGSSYGGHWVPGLAWNVLQQNGLFPGFYVNLTGIGIGDGWVDPASQTQTYANYAYSTSLMNSNQLSIVNYYQNLVATQLSQGQWFQAANNWGNILGAFGGFSSNANIYNVRFYGDYNEDNFDRFMNDESTKEMLHVYPNSQFASCNQTVYNYYTQDIMNSSIVFLPYILAQGVKVIMYNGQDDFIVNSPGVENMMAAIDWPYALEFINSERMSWVVNGQQAGYVQTSNNLTYVQILDAGHMTAYDQPVNVKNMVETFINGTSWSIS